MSVLHMQIQKDSGTPGAWIISDEAYDSLDQFRQLFFDWFFPTDGTQPSKVYRYPTVEAMIVGLLKLHMLDPAFRQFPPASLQAAKDAAATEQANYDLVHQEYLDNQTTPVPAA